MESTKSFENGNAGATGLAIGERLRDNPELPDPPAPNLFDGLDDWGAA